MFLEQDHWWDRGSWVNTFNHGLFDFLEAYNGIIWAQPVFIPDGHTMLSDAARNSSGLDLSYGCTLVLAFSPGLFHFQVPGLLDFFSPGTTGPRDLQGLQVLSCLVPGPRTSCPGTSRDVPGQNHFPLFALKVFSAGKKSTFFTLPFHTFFLYSILHKVLEIIRLRLFYVDNEQT